MGPQVYTTHPLLNSPSEPLGQVRSTFHFDDVLTSFSSQEDVFRATLQPLVGQASTQRGSRKASVIPPVRELLQGSCSQTYTYKSIEFVYYMYIYIYRNIHHIRFGEGGSAAWYKKFASFCIWASEAPTSADGSFSWLSVNPSFSGLRADEQSPGSQRFGTTLQGLAVEISGMSRPLS